MIQLSRLIGHTNNQTQLIPTHSICKNHKAGHLKSVHVMRNYNFECLYVQRK